MKKLIFILLTLSSFISFSATYYVATTGSDSNAGTIASPWATWQKGFETIVAGDILYIRGGTYATSGFQYSSYWNGVRVSNRDGNVTDTIKVFAYQNEIPILDCATMSTTRDGTHFGILMDGCDYWHIKGLTVKNCQDYFNGSVYGISNGWNISGSTHVRIEKCTVTSCGDGFVTGNTDDYIYFINCDSYKNFDRNDNGGYADGFQSNTNPGTHIFYIGCRAWQNSDDGYDQFGADGYITVDRCWAFRNGHHVTDGNGMGFKFGVADGVKESGVQRIITNNLAFDNDVHGFDESADVAAVMDMHIYNNTAFRNASRGFSFYQTSGSGIVTLINNVILSNVSSNNLRASVVQTTNSWQNGITATSADFISIDTTGVSGSRQTNGDMPNLNFLKLASGSNLIDAGTDVDISYNGSAPDLGAFEYSTTTTTTTSVVFGEGINNKNQWKF